MVSPSSGGSLVGRWRLLRTDAVLEFAAGVRMEFLPDGHLLYTIPVDNRELQVELIYRVEGDTLRTDNPLAPHATATRFEFGPGDVLILDFAGPRAWFVREL
ncbi:MAG: hypothetical protein ACT4P6_06690 [Gemmatimonadaceae bacterium]